MKKIIITYLFCLISFISSAQNKIYSFEIGTSAAILKGDFDSQINNPLLGKSGFYLGVKKPLSPIINSSLYVSHNSFGNNINNVSSYDDLHLRFKTNILTTNISVNFYPLPNYTLKPSLSVGVSIFHFNPKVDIKNDKGVYSFSNGNLTNTNGESTSLDNTFETSFSEINEHTYSKVSLGIPIGIGAEFKLSKFLSLKSSISYQYNLTDNIDNISDLNPSNIIEENGRNDHAIHTAIGLILTPSQFQWKKNKHEIEGIIYDDENQSLIISKSEVNNQKSGLEEIVNHYNEVKIVSDSSLILFNYNEHLYDGIDFDELDQELKADLDGDGVPDIEDMCPNTPKKTNNSQKLENLLFGEVKVDKRGCPIDTDNDGVPDYRDIEPNTKAGFLVNQEGKRLTSKEAEKLLVETKVVSREYANNYNKTTPIDLKFEKQYFPYITADVYQEIITLQQNILVHQIANNTNENMNSMKLLSMRRDSTINYLEKIKSLEIEYLRITSELKALKNVLTQSKKDVSFLDIEVLDFKPIDESETDVDHYQVYVHRIIQLIKLQNDIKKDLDE